MIQKQDRSIAGVHPCMANDVMKGVVYDAVHALLHEGPVASPRSCICCPVTGCVKAREAACRAWRGIQGPCNARDNFYDAEALSEQDTKDADRCIDQVSAMQRCGTGACWLARRWEAGLPG